ncbi:endonuclease MutS2 [Dyadobacter frigoris]|uniref:Endonuclease MutS2 n=1 Tax=Dyadobacter frigoris TaxID=2576211 RepID=A0A4U6D5M3_9BACT|nr:endonuclease MutS2 [Dyadobacter frigoris]TKT91507.1 endonuclease MutS2 [Dyadobacter frigoris]GLU51936.1 endonuclease MutS2 [Dyadobacter frigoris]
MLYPNTIEQKLGFDKLRELLKEACISPLGRSFVEKIRFSDNFGMVEKLVSQTAEMKRVMEIGEDFPSQNYLDATPYLKRAAIEGMLLTLEEFSDLKASLQTIRLCLRFFANQEPESFPLLGEYAKTVRVDKAITDSIDKIIDDRGQIRDTASPELSRIRKKLISEQAGIRKKLDTMLRTAKSSGWISEDVSLTVRNGRMVIPLAAEHKRKLKGFIHDESSTGQTVFIEPTDVFESNNEIRELEYEERREINRILMHLTDQLRPFVPDLQKAYSFLGLMDFLRAKAKIAIQMNATNPTFVNKQFIDWKDARHPLLHLSFQKQGKKVVPLNIELQDKQRILIVSGPNAGGKSVSLKTVGLIQYMHQCGLLVPMADGSSMGFFQNIFIDIGDEQSLENDLSTYSSHLTNMRHFLTLANKRTLFLIDEFGTGTEPGLGGAIAEAILEDLTKSGAYGVINTHYTNLKVLADKTEGLVNGAMRFDGEHLEPIYQLEIGRPGSSFAFEIASKIGLPNTVINRAKEKLGTQQVNFEKLLKELDIERKVFAEKNIELGIKERKAAQQLSEYTKLKSNLENNEKKLVNDAKQKAKNLLSDANQLIENTIREIKENKAEKEKTKTVRTNLENFGKKNLKLEEVEELPSEDNVFEPEDGAIVIGSYVRVIGQTAIGEILSLKGKDAEIRIGDLKSNIKLNRLEKVSNRTYKEATGEKKLKTVSKGVDLNERMMNFSFNLDIRGKRGEEALGVLDSFMDNAIMLGYDELRVVHGKGDGILRTLVRNHLRGYSHVAGMQDEHADRGGAGVTIVKLK